MRIAREESLSDNQTYLIIEYKNNRDEKNNPIQKWPNMLGYGFFALVALFPLVFTTNFIEKGISGIFTIVLWTIASGAISLLNLYEYHNIMACQKLMGETLDKKVALCASKNHESTPM